MLGRVFGAAQQCCATLYLQMDGRKNLKRFRVSLSHDNRLNTIFLLCALFRIVVVWWCIVYLCACVAIEKKLPNIKGAVGHREVITTPDATFRMKIALLVLSCLIAVSRQQNALWSMPQYHPKVPLQYHYPVTNNLRQWSNIFSGSYHPYYSYSQPQYVKYFPAQNNPGVVLFKSFQQQQPEEEQEINQDEYVNDETNQQESTVEARMGKPGKPGKPKNPEGRLFDNALLSNLLFGTVATSTKYSIATTTIVSTSVISCIPSASFSAGSTTACRRRRDLSVMKELLDDHEALSPSQVQMYTVEPSAALTLDSLSDSPRSARDAVTVVSSLEDRSHRRSAGARFIGLNALLTLTTTSTLTTATISVTSSRKTVTLGSSLLCLPSGINLC